VAADNAIVLHAASEELGWINCRRPVTWRVSRSCSRMGF